jgi:hypothetical protein
VGLELILILAVSAAFTRGIFSHRERMEYARNGLDSPADKRRAAKQATKLAGGSTASSGGGGGGSATAGGGGTRSTPRGPGFKDFALTLWSDLWEDAKKRHERERAKKRPDGGRRARDVIKGWAHWVKNPLGKNDPAKPRPGDVDPEQPQPAVPDPQDGQQPPAEAPTADQDARSCPECGGQLIEHPDGWYHPSKAPCPVDGRTKPYPGPTPPPDPQAGQQPPPPPAPVEPEKAEAPAPPAPAEEKPNQAPSPLGDDEWPTEEDLVRLERDAKHLAGEWCGDKNCGCTCRGCGNDRVEFDTGRCKSCKTPGGTPPPDSTTPVTSSAGGNTVALEFNYNAIVAAHQEMLDKLTARLEQATEVKTHAQSAAAAADGMDEGRDALVAAATNLTEGMEEARFDAGSLSGCAEAAEAFSAEDGRAIEEQTSELVTKAEAVISKTNAAIESVQASLDHIVAQYGDLADGVQSTNVRGEALEAV